MALVDFCQKFRLNYLTPYLVIIVGFLLILILHQFSIINEFQIIHFKHRQEKKRLVVLAAKEILSGQASDGQYNSLCSFYADRRGPHQKVISYSIYGDFSLTDVVNKYLKPFGNTINEIPVIYPGKHSSYTYKYMFKIEKNKSKICPFVWFWGWIVRIYHNLTNVDAESWKFLENISNIGSHVDLCNATEIIKQQNLADIFAMTWRWVNKSKGV